VRDLPELVAQVLGPGDDLRRHDALRRSEEVCPTMAILEAAGCQQRTGGRSTNSEHRNQQTSSAHA